MTNYTCLMVMASVVTVLCVEYASCVQMTIEPAVLELGSSDTPTVIMNCSIPDSYNLTLVFWELKRNSPREDGNYVVIASMTAGKDPELNTSILDVASRKPKPPMVAGARHQGSGDSPSRGYLSLTWDSKSLNCWDAAMYECSVKVQHLYEAEKMELTNRVPFCVQGTEEQCEKNRNGPYCGGSDGGESAGVTLRTPSLFHWLPLLILAMLQC